ncbi:146R [Invertebrate iridescent virus Kaz2018]|uniref:Putative MSV199 domain-containing protein 146R n=1 Tax=Invertebrate iridescent virus 6 TaxID=176652 RepID=146R_IIV6|nr:homing endonuclease with GIY-YIG motif [Invertebrate iridescent virus 6]O55751.1 RecName: Full=Putative MSV199 domain-containing protein 146R [Invertebrate iridescent virus 6]AAB94462.1 146R [Invertebrate iridescent virus 6]QNH08556.1 146R [Invertebrate iridescent virus Kaz2018]
MRKGYIYVIENNFDNHVYIGSTVDSLENRFRRHKADALKRPSCLFHTYMKKHGVDNFVIKLLKEVEIISILDLHLLEQNFIKDYGTLNTLHGKLKNLEINDKPTNVVLSKQTPFFTTIEPNIVKTEDVLKEITTNPSISLKELIDIFIEEEQNFGTILNEMTCQHKIYISKKLLKWIGYEGDYKKQRDSFKKLLKRHNIDFEELKSNDIECENYPEIKVDMANLSNGVISQSKWLILNIYNFKYI